jgi:hypothetical protein
MEGLSAYLRWRVRRLDSLYGTFVWQTCLLVGLARVYQRSGYLYLYVI